jgi:hypothetical protein
MAEKYNMAENYIKNFTMARKTHNKWREKTYKSSNSETSDAIDSANVDSNSIARVDTLSES